MCITTDNFFRMLVCCVVLDSFFSKNIIYTLKSDFAVILSNSLLFAGKALICSEKFPVIFVGNFCAGQGKNPENLRVCSNLGCVKFA